MDKAPSGKTVLSGIQPSGTLHIGNYLGALKQWVALQENNTAYYCIVDLHAITVPYKKEELQNNILNAAAIYLAVGIDPTKSVLFVQSHIPAHAELAWLLGTITPFGRLALMTQAKEKVRKHRRVMADAIIEQGREEGHKSAEETLNFLRSNPEVAQRLRNEASGSLGLFAYPVLMTSDILLYQTDIVPVGEDQVQHLELTRDIVEKFENIFEPAVPVFKTPKAYLSKSSARIMSLSDPTRKMSKSDGEKSYVAITDEPNVIKKKIMSAATDTEAVFSFEKSGMAVKNLLRIYQAFSEDSPAIIEQKFSGKGYKEFKETLADLIIEKLTPIREKYQELRRDEKNLKAVLEQGRAKAAAVANKTLQDVKEKMGLI